jgi:glycosyltransferase involved in cell wall biosynthesis/2-polyprenyl-3-methyl-5-hydroxy-6-metoxy-1,4-benzoquinol methylase
MNRVLLLADRPGWAHHRVAQELKKQLGDSYTFEIAFAQQRPDLDPNRYDVAYVFFWGERWHQRWFEDPRQVIKEISSHRFEYEHFGPHTPSEAADRYMRDAETLVATSQRLYELFAPAVPRVRQYRLGADPEVFFPNTTSRTGPISVCWVGNPQDPLKGRDDLLLPASRKSGIGLAEASGKLSQQEVSSFYRQHDVVVVSSVAEGTPLPLLEAMASGLWVISTDVGVAPEVLRDGSGGRLIPRNVDALSQALLEAAANPDRVRAEGLRNVEVIKNNRTWEKSSAEFSKILDEAIDHRSSGRQLSSVTISETDSDYDKHLSIVNPGGYSEETFRSHVTRLDEDISALLPESKSAKILEIGTGFGHCLRWLSEKGYARLKGVDLSAELLRGVRRSIGERVESLEVADGREALASHRGSFDLILMLDMIEHVSVDEARDMLKDAHRALAPGGTVVLRTPNMANVLGTYSRWMDITHRAAYTEQSLAHVLRQAGFDDIVVHCPQSIGLKRRAAAKLNRALHEALFSIQDRSKPTWYGKNIVLRARK